MTSLPFNKRAVLYDERGHELQTFRVAIWSTTGRNTDVGRAFDHEGQAPVNVYNALTATPNRRLEIDGVRYLITSAQLHEFVPHVSLQLRQMRSGGQG